MQILEDPDRIKSSLEDRFYAPYLVLGRQVLLRLEDLAAQVELLHVDAVDLCRKVYVGLRRLVELRPNVLA